jgi:maleate isomerase
MFRPSRGWVDVQVATGVPATTSILALNDALARIGVRHLGLGTPYRGNVQARIVANYAALGVECVAERHLDLQDNFSFAEVSAPQIDAMAHEVAAARPNAVAVVCTNLRGAPLVAGWEAALGCRFTTRSRRLCGAALALPGQTPL